MDLIFQIWGGLFSLCNKIMFALSEGMHGQAKKNLKIKGWVIYILGIPPWVTILVHHNDWIAASIEAGGVPAMLLGLYNTYHDNKKRNKLFNIIAALSTYMSLIFGLGFSVIHYGGITSISQGLEIGVMFGFLLGSYAMARNNPAGWYLFMLMNICMAGLMILQGKPILMAQQLLSLCFAAYGLKKSRNYVDKES